MLGSGAILTEVIKAAQALAADGITTEVFSVTSWSELARDGAEWQRRVLGCEGDRAGEVTRRGDGERTGQGTGGGAGQGTGEGTGEGTGDTGGREPGQAPYIHALLGDGGPIVAATDYVRAVPESIRAWLPEGRRYLTLGTDGFGRSDTRARLREYFGVDAAAVARAARRALEHR